MNKKGMSLGELLKECLEDLEPITPNDQGMYEMDISHFNEWDDDDKEAAINHLLANGFTFTNREKT